MNVVARLLTIACLFSLPIATAAAADRPNIVLVMADDMGYGQTGYYNHPALKTPNLDAMAANGLRFDRFYAGASNCSPTRSTVMTGRTNDRTGVQNHGVPMRPQEITIAKLLKEGGYATGHFGKWHLNGLRGPGAPILKSDIRSPGAFGFETWLSVTNFFDRDPLLSRNGVFEQHEGDSSEIVVAEALKFIEGAAKEDRPSFTVIWYGTPHSPFKASDEDRTQFKSLEEQSSHHYGELVAMDRSIGHLRSRLRELEIADDTLVWFNSDNGGLPKITPGTVGSLRGFKNSLYEGGLRVPAVLEWPNGIKPGRTTSHPAGTVDILPTLLEVTGMQGKTPKRPLDGLSIAAFFKGDIPDRRSKPLGFRHDRRFAWIDNDWKLVMPSNKPKQKAWELYNLATDESEEKNVIKKHPEVASRLRAAFEAWNQTVELSVAGKDYPEGEVLPPDPGPRSWPTTPEYAPYIEAWKDRWEFKRYIKR